MTIEQRDKAIQAVKESQLYLPLKAARIKQIQDDFDRQELIETIAHTQTEPAAAAFLDTI